MARPSKSFNADHAMRRYAVGASMTKIAGECGVDRHRIKHLLESRGIEIRDASDIEGRLDVDVIILRYEAGEGLWNLSEEFHVAPANIKKILISRGVHIRNKTEVRLMEWALIDRVGKRDAEVARRLKKAQDTLRGNTRTIEDKIKSAKGREGFPCAGTIPKHELELSAALNAKGITCKWQKAIGPYTVDLALEEHCVAVEVQRRNWTMGMKPGMCLSKERLEYILYAGWSVLVIYCFPKILSKVIDGVRRTTGYIERFDDRSVADKIVSLLETTGVFPTSGGQYGVIDGYAQPSSVVRLDLDGWPIIPGL